MTETAAPSANKIAGYQSLVGIFDGELFSNVEYFFANLEETGKIAQWNDAEIVAVLKSKLKGPALQFFINDPELLQETDFKKIKEKLTQFYSQKTTLSHRQQLFSNCRQNPGESVRSFSTRVSNLTINYFGLENSSKSEVAPIINQTKLAKFLEGLSPALKKLALTRNPNTFEEAVNQATLDELNSQHMTENETVNACTAKPSAQGVNTQLSEILASQAELSKQVIGALAQQSSLHNSNFLSPQNHNAQQASYDNQELSFPRYETSCNFCGSYYQNHICPANRGHSMQRYNRRANRNYQPRYRPPRQNANNARQISYSQHDNRTQQFRSDFSRGRNPRNSSSPHHLNSTRGR